MKRALLAWIDEENGLTEKDARACIEAFRTSGYTFFETRFLYSSRKEDMLKAVEETSLAMDCLALVVPKNFLSPTANCISERLSIPFMQGNSLGEGLFTKDGFTLFLLSFEEGREYAKAVCVPHLQRSGAERKNKIVLRCVGVELFHLRSLIVTAEKQFGDTLSFHYFTKNDDTVLEIAYGEQVSRVLTDDVLRFFTEQLDGYLYAMDDSLLEEQLVQLLKIRGKTISVAESFTGGGVSKRIVSVSGASEVYFEGVNAYSESAKQIRLGVLAHTLHSYGAVSDQTAYEMAKGLLATGNCDVVIATTGIAGPKSDRTDTPIGTCFIAVGTKEKIYVCRYRFDGTREEITEKAINHALYDAYRLLRNV